MLSREIKQGTKIKQKQVQETYGEGEREEDNRRQKNKERERKLWPHIIIGSRKKRGEEENKS